MTRLTTIWYERDGVRFERAFTTTDRPGERPVDVMRAYVPEDADRFGYSTTGADEAR